MKKHMKNYVKLTSLFLFSFFLASCSDSYYYAMPHPVVQTKSANIGHGKTIALVVNDGRTDKIVTTVHGAIPGGPKNHLMLANNAMESIYDAAEQGLKSQGFEVSHQQKPTTLTLTLNQLQQKMITEAYNLAPPRRLLQSTFIVRATRPGAVYQKTYHVEQNISVYHLNALDRVLTQNMNKIFSDRKLMAFLAG